MTNGTRRAATAATAVDLRRLYTAALHDPDVADGHPPLVWRLVDVHGQPLAACPCGRPYAHRDGHAAPQPRYCRCGLVHLEYRCAACQAFTYDPPRHDGCGPLPDPV